MKKKTSKLTLSGILFGIVIIIQLIKNISPFISGPMINAVLVVAVINLGLLWGLGFSIIIPITSIVFAPASAMTTVTMQTNGLTLPVIMIGNIIFVLSAYYGKKHGYSTFIIALILGAILKWLFMWGCGDLIIKPLFEAKLGNTVVVINKIFSTLQLYSGLISVVIIYPVIKALDKVKKDS